MARSDPAPLELPDSLRAVIDQARPLTDCFVAAGHELALVGGIVRDHLRGEVGEPDLDATTDARPAAIKALVAELADSVWAQGERFGTIGCEIDGQPWEITTYRADAYDEASRKPVVTFGDDLESDLARRDFTINAMAVDLVTATVIDPFGGAADLAARRLSTPLDPEISFSDDPLRMVRAARFVARFDLTPDAALVSAIEAMGARMSIVSIERIYDEMSKLLVLPDAGRGLRFLADTGLWRHVLPDVEWSETIAEQVDRVAPDRRSRWAVLLLGVDPGPVMRALKASSADERAVVALVAGRGFPRKWDEAWIRRRAAAAPPDTPLDDQLAFTASLGHPGVEEVAAAVVALRAAEPDLDKPLPPLDGLEVARIIGTEPGPQVGRALAWLANLRFEHGPFSADEARVRLAGWSDAQLPGSHDE